MFAEAKSSEDVKVYIEGQQSYVDKLDELVNLKIDDCSIVKSVENASQAINGLTICDLKLNVYGPGEDEVYAFFPNLVKNVRRGNTVLKKYIQSDPTEKP